MLHFAEGVRIIKDNLLPLPPIFKLIEEESGLPRKEMYQVFNMGHRLEAYTDESSAERMIEIAREFNIESRIIGHVVEADTTSVQISDDKGTYQLEG